VTSEIFVARAASDQDHDREEMQRGARHCSEKSDAYFNSLQVALESK